MSDENQPPVRHHLLIAGTGRAGTSFLVRWLAAMGLETHLAVHASPAWHDEANAGLEDLLVPSVWPTGPYVMKSPWLVEVIDEVLGNDRVVIDAVIIPVRDLLEAASSRVVREMQARLQQQSWLAGLQRGFEQWGTTPGGVVFSLSPVDQARLLAVSFHRLVHRLVQADIPVVLLDFPRLAKDPDYLYDKLRGLLPDGASLEQAQAAHAETADPAKIRVGGELAAAQPATGDAGVPGADRLNALAMGREVKRLGEALAGAEQLLTQQQAALAALQQAVDTQEKPATGFQAVLLERDAELRAAQP